jgi:death-on-curing protein
MILKLPSAEYIEELHRAVLKVYPGKEGILHRDVLETIVARPKNYVAYDNTNLHKVCAVMAHTISQDHPFTDANKRTALLTIISVYRLNGVYLEFTPEINGEFTTFFLWVVQENPTIDEITGQLQDIIEKYAKTGLEAALERIIDFF